MRLERPQHYTSTADGNAAHAYAKLPKSITLQLNDYTIWLTAKQEVHARPLLKYLCRAAVNLGVLKHRREYLFGNTNQLGMQLCNACCWFIEKRSCKAPSTTRGDWACQNYRGSPNAMI